RSIGTDQTDMRIRWDSLPTEDRWILSRLNRTIDSATSLMTDFQFGEAQKQIYEFLWGEFCDWYIELAKIRLRSPVEEVPSPIPVLVNVLETSLRLLHPYMPFVTEELWQNLRRYLPAEQQVSESIMLAPYPEADEHAFNPEAERVIEAIIEIIRSIRNVRAQYNVETARWIEAKIYIGELLPSLSQYSQAVETLARARPVNFLDSRNESPAGANNLGFVLKEAEVIIPMESMVDLEAERQRLEKEIEQSKAEITRLEARLGNREFITKAPAAVVDKERDKLGVVKDKLERLSQQFAKLQA
ncbi:class I tRNA ligase family protein, partial [Chloroflexota bacterium]